jgi:hypothetical protein
MGVGDEDGAMAVEAVAIGDGTRGSAAWGEGVQKIRTEIAGRFFEPQGFGHRESSGLLMTGR